MNSLSKKLSFALTIGIAILISSLFFTKEPWQALAHEDMVGIAMIIVGIAVVEGIWAWVGGSPVELNVQRLLSFNEDSSNALKQDLQLLSNNLKQDLKFLSTTSNEINYTSEETRKLVQHTTTIVNSATKFGLSNVGAKQDDLGYKPGKWATLVRNAKTGVDLCGATLNVVFSNDDLYTALVSTNVPVRILLPDPRSAYSVVMFKDEFEQSARDGARHLVNKIVQSNSPIQLKLLSRKVLTMCILRVDDTMLVVPYMYSSQTQNSPRFEIREANKSLFRAYKDEFEALFEIAEPVNAQIFVGNNIAAS
jgi:hypothetical protein